MKLSEFFQIIKHILTLKKEVKDPIGYYGAIEKYNDTDYLLGEEIVVEQAPFTFQDNQIQYNQKEVSHVSCTVHAAIGAYSDLTGYRFTLDERVELWRQAVELGADPNYGWYISSAVDLVRNFKKDVNSFRVDLASDYFFDVLDKGYSVVCGFRGNATYSLDKNDGILDGLEFGKTFWGHAVRLVKQDDMYLMIVDNYIGSDLGINTYLIPKENLQKLITNRVFFEKGYFYVRDMSAEMLKQARIKGLFVSRKIEISRARNKINAIERELAELENREPVKYKIDPPY